MGSFGERLRREREMRRVSLEEIAAATKIGTRSLKALEDEDFSKLPGGIFNKGFVRAYAKFLGMNEDQAVADYMAAAGQAEQNPDSMIEKLAAESERRAEEKRIREQNEARSNASLFSWNTIAIVVVVAVAAVLGWQYYGRYKARKEAARSISAAAPASANSAPPNAGAASTGAEPASVANPAVTPLNAAPASNTRIPAENSQPAAGATSAGTNATKPNSTAAANAAANATRNSATAPSADSAAPNQNSAPELTTGSAAQSTSAPGSSGPAEAIVVILKFNDKSWLSAEPDGGNRSQRIMPASSSATFRARKRLKLIVGNAGGVEVSFNGKPQPLSAEKGQARTLIFTPDGLQQ